MSISDSLAKSLINAQPEAILIVDSHGNVQLSNATCQSLLHYADDMAGQSLFDIDIALSKKGFIDLKKALNNGQSVTNESTYLSGSDEELTLNYQARQLNYQDEQWIAFTLSPDKPAVSKGTPPARDLRALFSATNDALLLLDGATQTIIMANQKAVDFLGYSLHQLRGSQLSDYHAGSHDDLDLFLDTVLDNQIGQTAELTFINNEKINIPTEVSATHYHDADNEGVIVLLRPISTQRQIESTLTRIVEKALSKSKMEFIPAFVEEMANVLGVMCIGITQSIEGNANELQFVSLWYDGRFEKNYKYPIANTPSARVLEEGMLHIPSGISQQFSHDTFLTRMRAEGYLGIPVISSGGHIKGHFFIIDDKPLVRQPWIEVLLQIAANRLALELERKEVEDELKQRMDMEALVSEISAELINSNAKNIDEKIDWLLRKIGQFVDVDRTYVFKLEENLKAGSVTHEWTLPERTALKEHFQNFKTQDHPWPFELLMAKRMLLVHDIREHKADMQGFERVFQTFNITSMLNMPLVLNDKVYGFLGFNTEERHPWSIRDIVLLKLVSEVLISTISRINYETNLKQINDKLEEEVMLRTRDLEAALSEVSELKQKVEAENTYLKEEYNISHPFDNIVSHDPKFNEVLAQAKHVADTPTTVLIMGETGTGKEVISQFIHDMSDRKDKPLIKINCAALPATLIESELFGHEKGAFTGAANAKQGRFELASGGTLFLDEIGEVPIELQPKLLRAIQEGEFERLGGTKSIKVDVRLVAATNRNLLEEVQQGNFRSDLYYRLNVFPINIPPLRERKKDIKPLVNYFMNKHGQRLGKKIKKVPVSVIDKLEKYQWPGNVRELENIIERAVIISPESHLVLGNWLVDEDKSTSGTTDKFTSLEEYEKRYIIEVLKHTNWKVSGDDGAANILQLKPTTLDSKLKKLGIIKPK